MLEGLGGRAGEVTITAAGASRVLVYGYGGGTSGEVVVRRVAIAGGDGKLGSREVPEGYEPPRRSSRGLMP